MILVHCKIVAAYVLYSFSLLEAAFVMWCKIVVNTNYITGYLNADFWFHCNYLILSNTSFQSNERQMSEQVLNWFSSIQFLGTTYASHVGLLRGGFCVFDVINTTALSAQFVGHNAPALCSRFFTTAFSTSAVQRPPPPPEKKTRELANFVCRI